ncbi:unnamed protein product [Allacma fusca]|uniref:G-protein coupled receptors family 1 profile domain-containing protein n=1 Tax=Allacma fusca TaxID=39272 RepID=A0A8J2P649_9HEXA|nr:unnamed protein product [Allacma fusca]
MVGYVPNMLSKYYKVTICTNHVYALTIKTTHLVEPNNLKIAKVPKSSTYIPSYPQVYMYVPEMEHTEIPYFGNLPGESDSAELEAGPSGSVFDHSQGMDARSFNHSDGLSINPAHAYNIITPDFYPDFTQIPVVRGIFIFLFMLEFVVSVTGNLLVCLTVYRTKAMHSPVNYYIVNLGICDFLVGIFVLPTKLFELTAEEDMSMLNNVVCTVLNFLETIVIFTSVFTLVAICIERYYAVVYPVHSRIYLTHSRIGRVLLVVWIIPIIVASPSLIFPATAEAHHLYSDYGSFSRTTCMDGWILKLCQKVGVVTLSLNYSQVTLSALSYNYFE